MHCSQAVENLSSHTILRLDERKPLVQREDFLEMHPVGTLMFIKMYPRQA